MFMYKIYDVTRSLKLGMWFPDEDNGKVKATTTSNTNSSLGFLPINFKLATTTQQNQCVIRWFRHPSVKGTGRHSSLKLNFGNSYFLYAQQM